MKPCKAAQLNSTNEDFEECNEEESEASESAEENIRTSCDVCDRHFSTDFLYQKHLKEHRVCGIDGCTFTAHGKIVDKHIEMQHSTGLYDKIRNISTPEDIARWIEERKRKFATRENIEKSKQQQEEMIKRGERLQKNNKSFSKKKDVRFAQVKKGSIKQKRKVKNLAKLNKVSKPLSLIDDKLDWNGTLFPFRGTSELYGETTEENVSDFDDSEWLEESVKPPVKRLEIKNALSTLMSAYNSDDESESEVAPEEKIVEHEEQPSADGANDDAPIEVKIIREPEQCASEIGNLQVTQQQESNNKNKKKRRRSKHAKTDVPNKKSKMDTTSLNAKERNFMDQPFRKRKVTLLERLLDNEIRHERNVVLQCVRFVVANNYFKNV